MTSNKQYRRMNDDDVDNDTHTKIISIKNKKRTK